MSRNSSAPLRGTIYSLGYSQRTSAAILQRLLNQPQVLLLDVRSQPICHWNRQWNRAELSARYGEQYHLERRLGNVNSWSHIRSVQLPTGWQEAVHDAAALLCACRDERACHRSLIAKLIQDALPIAVTAGEVLA
jgi:uncharacterized protein (DUF488 family)